MGRELRDLQFRVDELERKMNQLSIERLEKYWQAIRETVDHFSAKLAAFEVDRQRMSNAIGVDRQRMQQFEQAVQMLSVNVTEMQAQVNQAMVNLLELQRAG